mmetsp:Transcript_16264/g.38918  ORF Transcript_16264/g.38918 Transcript_16264/m.38918 type:complete len:94 (-) Transcript_16264:145-426(-)
MGKIVSIKNSTAHTCTYMTHAMYTGNECIALMGWGKNSVCNAATDRQTDRRTRHEGKATQHAHQPTNQHKSTPLSGRAANFRVETAASLSLSS